MSSNCSYTYAAYLMSPCNSEKKEKRHKYYRNRGYLLIRSGLMIIQLVKIIFLCNNILSIYIVCIIIYYNINYILYNKNINILYNIILII